MKGKSKVKLFFSTLFLNLCITYANAQQQVDFDREVDRIESLIQQGAFEEANSVLIDLQLSLENTSLIAQDTVRLYFSSKFAFIANQLGDCENTISKSKEDLNLRTEIYGAADPLTLSSSRNLGIYYLNCDSAEMAKQQLQITVDIHRDSIGQPDELYARSLDDLAYVRGKLGDIDGAIKNYNELLGLLGDSKSSFYLHVAENYSALLMSSERYEEAAAFYEDLKGYMTPKSEYPFFLKDFYNVFVHQKNYVKALETATELLTWCDSNKSACSETGFDLKEFVLNSARLSVLLFRYEDASKYYTRAEDLYSDSPKYISVLLEQSDLYNATGEKYKQLNTLSKSLITHRSRSMTDSASYTKTVLELGKIHTEMGRFERADEVFSEYIDDLEANPGTNAEKLAVAYQSLGNQRYLLQNFKDADKYLSKAQNILVKEGLTSSSEYASVLNSLGALYEALANYRKAEKNYRKALHISYEEESGLRVALATNLANILTRTQPKNDSILVLLNQAINWQETSSGKDHPGYANLLSNRAVYYQKNESYKLALADFEQAIKIFKYTVPEDHPQYLSAMSSIGLLYNLMDRMDEALESMLIAKSLYLKYYSEAHPGYIRTVNNLANLYTKTEQYDLAEPLLLSLAQSQVKEINESFTYLSESEKKTFVEEKQKLLNNFKGYVVARSTIEEGSIKPNVIEDWYNLELSTKGMLLNSTKKVREQIFNSGDKELIDLFSEWTVARKQIADLQSLKSDLKQKSKTRLDSLLQKTNDLEKELSRRSAEFDGSFGDKSPTYDQITAKLKSGEATVEIIRTEINEEGIYTALIGTANQSHPKLIVLGKGKDFESNGFTVYKNAIKFKVDDPKSFDLYWRDIHEYLLGNGITKIFYAPDGIYHKISLNTLYDPASKNYLIDELEVFQLSSTKDFLNLNVGGEQFEGVDKALLVGRPSYKLAGNDVASIGTTRSFAMLSDVSDLPGTEEEIKEIQSLIDKSDVECQVLLKDDAKESVVKSQLNRGLVHIATHGFFMEDDAGAGSDPMLSSGLLLAGVSDFNENESGEDGILTAYEIMNLGLNDLQMVVLSACETGLGEISSGEGIYGLQRAFFVGGAQSVVMSLWKVDDEATKDLMTIFYKDYLKNGNKREAFLNAQKKIKKKYKNPIYWGAFVMLGG
ncbi:Tetratricopeptide repeat-containing protein [Ekhidna lutea]|uniref:Tetratricopeptide repeat-containing protein n=1 Tax=Ekhidna lutea TaxID=447679 RepID=A0A239J556_EKHLU|nr:CHAT domain-containing protein [Ekhidna lutea]SNS99784.1 Tetratricopeptide repeat-containing protein [Ekhidna lutea]